MIAFTNIKTTALWQKPLFRLSLLTAKTAMIVFALLLSACSADDGDEQGGGSNIEIGASSRAAVLQAGEQPEWPEGTEATIYEGIAGNSVATTATATYQTTGWKCSARVKDGIDYFFYGYMPTDIASAATIEKAPSEATDYSNGATLSLANVDAINTKDLCVLVGVQDMPTKTTPLNVRQGLFAFRGKPRGENFAHMLFAHLYSSISFRLAADPNYSKLRKIVIHKLTLNSPSTAEKLNIQVTAKSNDSNTYPLTVAMTPAAGSDSKAALVFIDDEEGQELTTAGKEFPAFFASLSWDDLYLYAEYDIYDRKGNLVREHCTATNRLSAVLKTPPTAGVKLSLSATVKPTYLYQLSEYDLDNPDMTLE